MIRYEVLGRKSLYTKFAALGKTRCTYNMITHALKQSAFKVLGSDVCLIVLKVLLEGTTSNDDCLVCVLLTYRRQISFVVMHARVVSAFDPIFVQTEKFGSNC